MKKTLSLATLAIMAASSVNRVGADELQSTQPAAGQQAQAPAPAPAPQSQTGQPGDSGVVNGADVADFLGSGPTIDRDKMDATLDREYNRYVRLDPLKPGECAPSVNPSVENAELAAAKKANKGKNKGFKGFIKSVGGAFTDAAGLLGFPIGPQDDDARTDKWDNM